MAITPAKPEVQQHGQGEKDHILCSGINKQQRKKKGGGKKEFSLHVFHPKILPLTIHCYISLSSWLFSHLHVFSVAPTTSSVSFFLPFTPTQSYYF